jgi:hypothetical protein
VIKAGKLSARCRALAIDGCGPCRCQQRSDGRETGAAAAVGKKAIMPDAMKAVGQAVEQEPANELIGVQGHVLLGIPMPVVALDVLPVFSSGLNESFLAL